MGKPKEGRDPAPGARKPCDTTAARVRLGPVGEIRVQASEFSGACYVHVREYMLGDDNEYHATQKGVAVPIERLAELLDAVKELRAAGDSDQLAAVVPLGNRREIRFSITAWKGTRKADIRVYLAVDGADDKVATKKGIRFNITLLAEIERGLEALDRGAGL